MGERFVSKVLPFFKRQTKQVRDLIPELYLHGSASGDFEMALRGLLGEGAPLSAHRYSGSRRNGGENTSSGRASRSRKENGLIFERMGSITDFQRGRVSLLAGKAESRSLKEI
jgi:hypothetical protein